MDLSDKLVFSIVLILTTLFRDTDDALGLGKNSLRIKLFITVGKAMN